MKVKNDQGDYYRLQNDSLNRSIKVSMKLESVDLASFWRLIKQLHPEKNIIDIENKKRALISALF